MGTGKIKILPVVLLILCTMTVYGQTEHVDIYNPVYRFLERMDNHNIIRQYNSFEIPKSRKEIAFYLQQVIEQRGKIGSTDQNILSDLETEYEKELYNTTKNSVRIINGSGYNFLHENEKFLYFRNAENFDIYINLIAGAGYIHRNIKDEFNNNAAFVNAGGIIRGNISDRFGFYIKGTNGNIFGNTRAALADKRLAQNFKFTEKPDESFYDETEGYLTADFDLIRFKFGRDRIRLGYGDIALIDDNSPVFDYLGLNLKYEFFNYSFIHAKMLDLASVPDVPFYGDKFLVYHRIGFNINRHFNFGAGEYIIYGRRGIDLSYLNPFAFYKSIEHANRDRDNSMLFFDFNNKSIPKTKIHLAFLIDDIAWRKAGTGWYGNQVMFNTGITTNDIAGLPADLSINYRRTEPYTFTHRISHNNFTNLGYSIAEHAMPNSELYSAAVTYRLNYRLEISSGMVYILHGANPVDGEEIINVGGDINLGHRYADSETTVFLAGIKEYYRLLNFLLVYEPVNNIFFRLDLKYLNNSVQTAQSHKELQSFFTLITVF
jgi:hypothetical protein